ncbi:geranylgeranyl diphosphate synthase, type I [Amycolatopsis xylanica]|uniref:Geranylgeranyl diphosphate synthase, type I n=1 Tax=Amycolatopsis xylanica TaxID=589385 RepID=A0A1H3FW56_9PSEU|nr:polyprenyl synthetase family protein [Amycolatopsis xylanica]SDX94598.1 geranylgeranyl diphosphate synthase, type I [Amycolatopsis xylanica]
MTTDVSAPDAVAAIRHTSRRLLDLVERQMSDFLAAERLKWAELNPRAVVPIEAVTTLVEAGGKRIRPAFCVSGFLAAGGDPDDRRVVHAAIALELLHACALIHDDVMDASPQRRGMPTVHAHHSELHSDRRWQGEARRFGESVAILAGDLALIYSDQFMANTPAANAVWNELRAELIVGQYLDIGAAAEFSVDPQLSRQIAIAKSGGYTIHRPLVVGASIAGRPELAGVFEVYGTALGEAFQLRDDLIDAFGDAEVTGKPAGLDFDQHKMTLLLALAMQRDDQVRELVLGAVPDAVKLREALISSGVRAAVEDRITALVAQSCRAIADAPIAREWRDELTAMTYEIAYRDR